MKVLIWLVIFGFIKPFNCLPSKIVWWSFLTISNFIRENIFFYILTANSKGTMDIVHRDKWFKGHKFSKSLKTMCTKITQTCPLVSTAPKMPALSPCASIASTWQRRVRVKTEVRSTSTWHIRSRAIWLAERAMKSVRKSAEKSKSYKEK